MSLGIDSLGRTGRLGEGACVHSTRCYILKGMILRSTFEMSINKINQLAYISCILLQIYSQFRT